MGIEDRDWFRERTINYDRGGLEGNEIYREKKGVMFWFMVVFSAIALGVVGAIFYMVFVL